MADETEIVSAAMALRGAAPHEWERFLQAMRVYNASLMVEVVRAAPDNLVKAQGHAQGIDRLTNTLVDAPTRFDKLRAAQVVTQRRK